MRIKFFLIMAAIAALAVAAQEAADLDPFAFLAGRELSAPEAAGFEGGDVRIDVDSSRSRARVRVWDNEYESRLGRSAPIEDYTVEVHNRIVKTKEAPFMPTGKSEKEYAGQTGITTKPVEFPAGSWKVTGIKECDGKYGPYMIKTNAIGKVEVYQDGKLLGMATDCGYALHSNTNDFSRSLSLGCIVLKQEDTLRIVESITKDQANYSAKKISTMSAKGTGRGPNQTVKVPRGDH